MGGATSWRDAATPTGDGEWRDLLACSAPRICTGCEVSDCTVDQSCICTCSHGTAATGADCTADQAEICMKQCGRLSQLHHGPFP